MNQSIITGLGTPQLSRIIEQGDSHSRKTEEESVYNLTHHNQAKKYEQQQELDGIEEQIKLIGKQLQHLHYQMKKIQDKYCEQYLQKEHVRNQLRKHLIDLDYKHKIIFAKKIKKNNGNSIINQFYDNKVQYQSPIKNNDQNLKQKNQRTRQNPVKYNSPTHSYTASDQKIKSKEENLQQSERRLRKAAIESQLNQQKLHRSQNEKLTKQLVYLRGSYSYPYLFNDYYSQYYYPTYSPLSSWWMY